MVGMNYDGLVLAAVAAELEKALTKGRIQGIRQHNETDLTFEIRGEGRTYLLFMSVHARFPRVYLASSSAPAPQTPPNFCMLLRKHLRGAFVTRVTQVGFDRVLNIHTEASDGNRNVLVLELMGKHSNLILLSDPGKILGAAKHVTAAVSRYRQVLPGRDYLPPPGGKANPIQVTRQVFDQLWLEGIGSDASPGNLRKWLIAAFSGIGPFLADEILLRAEGTESDAVWKALEELRRVVAERDYEPRLITDDRGRAIYAYPIPVRQHPAQNQHVRMSMNETLDTLFRDLIRREEFESELASLGAAIRRAVSARERTAVQLQTAVAEGQSAERYKQFGELLLAASGGAIAKGQTVARVMDYYDTELREVEIPLDEKLTPQENAERYFKRYRKAREGAVAAADRLKDVETETKILSSALERLPSAASVDNLRALRKMLTERGLLRPEPAPAAPGRPGEPEFGSAKIRRVTSADGVEVLYGENSVSNDYLTTKVARPNDLWFHARSVAGAHVVVRTGNRPESVPRSTIREAAEIAARNSEAKHSSLVAVDYTLRKHVRKPKSSPPGFVTYQREKTIDVGLRE